jgi:hypothetical protein
MAAKKKGPGKGRGPATRPPSPAKRTTIPKQAAAKPPADAANQGGAATPGRPSPPKPGAAGKPAATTGQAPSGPTPTPTPAPSPRTAGRQAGRGAPSKPGPQSSKPGGPSAKRVTPAKGGGQAGKAVPPAKGAAAKASSARAAGASGKGSVATPTPPAAPGKGRPRGGPTKEERLAAAAAARRRQAIRNKALVAAGVVVVLLVVGFVIVSDRRERAKEAAAFQTASCTFDRESDGDAGPGRNHVPNPSYDVDPPAGGDHTAEAASAGIFTADRLPLEGQVVHALEHGFIVFWHRPDLDEARLTQLREVAQEHPGEVLMVPRPTLPTPVAATAWHVRLLCQDVEADTLERFVDTFVDRGPEKGFVSREPG